MFSDCWMLNGQMFRMHVLWLYVESLIEVASSARRCLPRRQIRNMQALLYVNFSYASDIILHHLRVLLHTLLMYRNVHSLFLTHAS